MHTRSATQMIPHVFLRICQFDKQSLLIFEEQLISDSIGSTRELSLYTDNEISNHYDIFAVCDGYMDVHKIITLNSKQHLSIDILMHTDEMIVSEQKKMLNTISSHYYSIPYTYHTREIREATLAFQKLLGIPSDGILNEQTRKLILQMYDELQYEK